MEAIAAVLLAHASRRDFLTGALAFGFWLLAFGFWLLAFGFWLLALGSWLLARWRPSATFGNRSIAKIELPLLPER
ncbi:MAG: hypothetical protein COC14_12810 [Burkholderiaceae bacterium]|uniref:Uncharacterized protein n=1 Tax=Cupriavidus metallidurans TaxID=119219 RepID=A0A482IWI0_9BURK|nr:MAG: hypothetical protein COC14_12810 [Burkholderiaceae bacterium]QBP13445.1 hypothetical protein DDF84_027920 [Cupriavidus metallidurans]